MPGGCGTASLLQKAVACERTVGDETRASISDARRERRARARTPDRTSKPLELRHIELMFRCVVCARRVRDEARTHSCRKLLSIALT